MQTRHTITLQEFRRAYRTGDYTAREVSPMLEEIVDDGELMDTIESLYEVLSPDPRLVLVSAVGRLDRPVDDFLTRVLLDPAQTGHLRFGAAQGLARRGAPEWEPRVAEALVAHGRSPDQRFMGALVLSRWGNGSEWATVLSFLVHELTRRRRYESMPTLLECAVGYVTRGVPDAEVPNVASALRGNRAAFTADERRWVSLCWPALYRDTLPIGHWNEHELARWKLWLDEGHLPSKRPT